MLMSIKQRKYLKSNEDESTNLTNDSNNRYLFSIDSVYSVNELTDLRMIVNGKKKSWKKVLITTLEDL